jgi:hypothetical protein
VSKTGKGTREIETCFGFTGKLSEQWPTLNENVTGWQCAGNKWCRPLWRYQSLVFAFAMKLFAARLLRQLATALRPAPSRSAHHSEELFV